MPAPAISYWVNVPNDGSRREVMAQFRIFVYNDDDGDLITVHHGDLLFSLVRDRLSWEIQSVRVFNPMRDASSQLDDQAGN